MFNIWLNRATLEGMYLLELTRRFVFYRNTNRREIRQHQLAFYKRIWQEAAQRLGASWESIGRQIAEIDLNGCRTRVCEYTSEIDSSVTCALLHEKPLVHQILQQHALPVPRHASFALHHVAPAVEFLRSAAGCCVVKPANGGAGRGVTTGIRRRRDLARAIAVAAAYGNDLMIEEQIQGDNYRLLYLDGQLIDAFVRRPPSVIGDGRSSVAALVRRANEQRLEERDALSQVLIPKDFDMRQTLGRQGLSLRSVPAEGRVVTLKTVVNDNSGLDNSTVTHLLHPAIVEAGRQAVEALRVRFAGIDVITPNPAVSLADCGGVILEVNSPPGLYYHYHKRDGAFPAAYYVLKRLLAEDSPAHPREHVAVANQLEGTLA